MTLSRGLLRCGILARHSISAPSAIHPNSVLPQMLQSRDFRHRAQRQHLDATPSTLKSIAELMEQIYSKEILEGWKKKDYYQMLEEFVHKDTVKFLRDQEKLSGPAGS